MTEKKTYTKIMAKLWSILLEYEHWEEMTEENYCFTCDYPSAAECQNCPHANEKMKKQLETLKKAKHFLNKEL